MCTYYAFSSEIQTIFYPKLHWRSQLLPDPCGYCQNRCVRTFIARPEYNKRSSGHENLPGREWGIASFFVCLFVIICKGTYACLRLRRDQGGNIRDTVAHVASSDLRCRSVVRLSVRI